MGGSPHVPRKLSLPNGTALSVPDGDDEVDAPPPEAVPPGHGRCSYCDSVMPSLRLLMHQRHCQQSTFKCPLCKCGKREGLVGRGGGGVGIRGRQRDEQTGLRMYM